uniref:5-hydroxytryptamine receptor 7-like n=1 Tax=Saccoglossus kowalevskii TaxID=10224 RepID=A0ABM0M3U3_SACKO|nr:PREDICTED: 5-hydroxytryptamine receptor 7-like [Saccoglossus kowalevskii]
MGTENMGSERDLLPIVIINVILILIIATAVFGNVLVCVAVYRSRALRNQVSNLFIVNLALTDCCNAVLVMPASLASTITNRWVFSSEWCNGVCFLNYCFIIVSMCTLGLISLDRYFAVAQPLHYQTIVTRVRACVFIASTWVLGFIFASPPVFMNWIWYDNFEVVCAINWEENNDQVVIYTLSAFAICFCVPAIVMMFSYYGIYKIARKHSRLIAAENDRMAAVAEKIDQDKQVSQIDSQVQLTNSSHLSDSGKNTGKQERNNKKQSPRKGKATRTIVTMVAVFFICLTPFCITKVLKAVYKDNGVVGMWVNTLATLLAYFNSCCNPIIYSITRRDFRRAFMVTLRCLRKYGKTPNEVTVFNISVFRDNE